jgi:hypothetical protein
MCSMVRPVFGIEKQLDRMVETLALSALLANDPNGPYKNKIKERLNEIAFPLEIELEEADLSISGFYKRAKKELENNNDL